MKNKLIYSLLAVSLLTTSCKDDWSAPDSLSDVSWVSNVLPGTSTDKNEGDYISFIDLSVNATSHTWTIDEENNFLRTGFTSKDSLPLFIDKEKGHTTTDKAIHILLNKPGINKIRLRDTFNEKVVSNTSRPIAAVFENGQWVVDTVLEIKVYGKMRPACIIYKDQELTQEVCRVEENQLVELKDSLSWPTVELEAGESLYCVDMTTYGEPTTRFWSFPGSKKASSKDSIAVAPFFKLGKYNGLSLKAVREKPFPEANVMKYIPLNVQVNKSTKPFVSDGTIKEREDMSLAVSVAGELETVPQTHALKFTVHVKNANGFDENIGVSSISKDPKDLTNLILKLAKPIYNSDEVTVAYNASDDDVDHIQSVDGRILKSFTATPVSMWYASSVCKSPDQMGFEVEEIKDVPTCGCDGWWAANPTNWYRDITKAYSGKASLCCNTPKQGKSFQPWIQTDDNTDPNSIELKAGSYKVRMHIFIDESCNQDLKKFWGYIAKPWTVVEYDMTTAPRGKWVTFDSKVLTFTTDITTKMQLKFNGDAVINNDVKFYVDQIEILPIQVRP